MKILITGSSGMLGYSLCQWLNREQPQVLIQQFDLSTGHDVRNYDQVLQSVEGKDLVIHAAALTHVDFSLHNDLQDQKKFVDTNVNGTLNVIKACEKYKVKMIYISSSEVYGQNVNSGKLMSEDHPLNAQAGIYATTKLCADRTCKMETLTQGADIVILRPFNFWGVHQSVEKAIPRFIYQFLNGEYLTVYGDGEQLRDYVWIQDVARAIWLAKDLPSGTVANVCTGKPIKIKDLASMVSSKVKLVDPRPAEVAELRGDYSYFNKLTGWKPTRFINKDTIANLIGWYRENEWIHQKDVT